MRSHLHGGGIPWLLTPQNAVLVRIDHQPHMACAAHPALGVLDNSRKARVHTVTDHQIHSLSHKGDADDREEMNDL